MCAKSVSLPPDIAGLFTTHAVEKPSSPDPSEERILLRQNIARQFFLRWSKEVSSYPRVPSESRVFYGLFKKRQFSVGSKIAIHADFHGNLKALQLFYQFVDDVERRETKRVTPVMLGDLMDRGMNSFSTLYFALANHRTEIIRGNHESVSMNRMMLNEKEREFLAENSSFETVLENGYKIFPQGLFIGCEGGNPSEYLLCSHGAFDPDMDFLPFLQSTETYMFFNKQNVELSPRLQGLLEALPPSFREVGVNPDLVVEYLENRAYSAREIQMITTALQIHLLLQSPDADHPPQTMKQSLQESRNRGDYSSMWGRISPQTQEDFTHATGYYLSDKTILAFFRAHPMLKFLVRGHDHLYCTFEGRLPVCTLPVAPSENDPITEMQKPGESPTPPCFSKDRVLLITITGLEVSQWKAEIWSRKMELDDFVYEGDIILGPSL